MGNSNLSNGENILVKVDQNNLMYIDPNSVITNDGEIQPRGIEQEKLVMYVNLEADIIPRSILASQNDKNTLTSIAKGTLNFLSNSTDRDLDSNWTEAYLNSTEKKKKDENGNIQGTGEFFQSDSTGQSFGIDSINISVKGANFVPQVNINFIDVRGKTLFESAENSPYKAFFHIPWPIFYLTVKGYYGKAIRYRLHLVKFNTKFNESNGNFEVATSFVGSTYAYLNDIPLKGILNAPYMYMIETTTEPKFDPSTGTYKQEVSKGSRGYEILKSVYSEYMSKNLIPKNFPVKTLRELGVIAQSLDKLLEKKIFDQVVDMKIFAGIKDFETNISSFEAEIKAWAKRNLSTDIATPQINGQDYYYLSAKDKTETINLTGNTNSGTLEKILEAYKLKLKNSELFANTILKNTTGSSFSRERILSRNMGNIGDYITAKDGKQIVAIDLLINHIHEIRKSFSEQRDKLEKVVEDEMNKVVKSKDGFGFEPTVRNIFAVVLANAEVYIRLMKDVHRKAFDVSEQRKTLLQGYSNESTGEAIYPWPEVKKGSSGNKQQVIAYPGEPELQEKLKSNNRNLWPEIDFLENYVGISTNKYDPLGQKEGGVNNINYVFQSDLDISKLKKISAVNVVSTVIPYTDKSLSSFLYEIYERANLFMSLDVFDTKSIEELADAEFENIRESIKDDSDIIGVLYNNVNSKSVLRDLMLSFSPFERYKYYSDQIPSQTYLKEVLNTPVNIEQYKNNTTAPIDNTSFVGVSKYLRNYTPEPYRKEIFPFSSNLYLDYTNQIEYKENNFKFNGFIDVNLKEGFLSSVIDPSVWVKSSSDSENMFGRKLKMGYNNTNILNTPYFHKQLFTDFNRTSSYGKYVGASYLLLNSLPFKELEDKISYVISNSEGTGRMTDFRMSSLFREIGSSHYIPYHLILKWGSLYHRYKKFILDGTDILNGFVNSSNVTQNINGSTFFNNDNNDISNTTYLVNGEYVSYLGQTDVGIHPYYDAIFHQVVNGYNHFSIASGSTSFEYNLSYGAIKERVRTTNELSYWTGVVNNTKFNNGEKTFTILPCDGNNENIGQKVLAHTDQEAKLLNVFKDVGYVSKRTFTQEEQYQYRIIWENEIVNEDFNGRTFPSHSEYNRTYVSGSTKVNDDKYELSSTYRKVIDLIGTFSPTILEQFEDMFLQFATEKKNEEMSYKRFENVNYYQFQDLLKDIVTVKSTDITETETEALLNQVQTKQAEKLKDITKKILSNDNLIKVTLANPKEIDLHLYDGFAGISTGNTFSYDSYDSSQLTTTNRNFIKLYIGEDINSYYENFFVVNNVELSEENIILFRPLILIYAGYKKTNSTVTKVGFQNYIKEEIFQYTLNSKVSNVSGVEKRVDFFLDKLIPKFRTLTVNSNVNRISIVDGYNNRDLKIELYSYFKSFNDKWVAGNSLGQRNLMEEFLFLDKANKDVGDKVYMNLDRIIPLIDPKNDKQNLYGAISMLIQGTGFDMRALPAYVNFYGTNFSTKSKITPSTKVAKNLFGTFLEVDYQESSPKILIQYTGPASKHPDMESKNYKFADDSFNIANVNNNPLIITTPEVFNTGDLSKSNKVVAFEVSFGDQNQSIFKGVQLDQSSIRNTTESFVVLENLARSESGSGSYNVDIGLFEYYRQASYTCEVTCMGNVMIQPTMFFYLKNIPMFKGSYWITEVSHNIRNNNIVTTFKGTRIPYASLPDPKDSFVSSYRALFDKLMNKAVARIKEEDRLRTPTTVTLQTPSGSVTIDPGPIQLPTGDKFVEESGVTPFGVPYNGFNNERYIQKVSVKDKGDWYRAVVVMMGSEKYKIEDTTTMSLLNQLSSDFGVVKPTGLQWSEIKDSNKKFYSLRFQLSPSIRADKIVTGKTSFLNPNNGKETTVNPSYQLNSDLGTRSVQGPVNIGPNLENYGIALSQALMTELGLLPDQVVYFKIT